MIFSATVGADVFISEKRTSANGVFATITATDDDATAPNNQVSYDITGGTGEGLFDIDANGGISVASSATFDYDTTTSYTLTITATDGGTPAMTSEAKTITIGLIENGEAVYSISENGDILTATRDSTDPDGIDTASISYQWYTSTNGGITKDAIATSGTNSIAVTNAQTLNTAGHTLPDRANYVVEISYTDGLGFAESVDAILLVASITLEDNTTTTTATIGFPSVSFFTINPVVVGGGDVTYTLGGTDGSLFQEFQGKIFTNARLDFDRVQYQFTVTATESVGGTSDTATFTLNTGYVPENGGEAVYSISQSGNTLTAMQDSTDPDGVEVGSVAMYRWFTTTDAGANRNYLGTASTSNTLDTSISGNGLPQNAVYGVEITYTDGLGFDESVDARQSTIAFSAFIISARTPSIDITRVTSAINNDNDLIISQALSNAVSIVGSGMASFSITGGADKDHFTIAGSRNNLNLLTSADNFPTTQTSFVVEITATNSANADTAVLTFTVRIFGSVGSASPAQIPDRQAEAHDPYNPDDDPLVGMTPLPDADPNA